jgi:transposase
MELRAQKNYGTGRFTDGSRPACRWSPVDRQEILDAAFAPGANVPGVARRFDVSTGPHYTWRRQALSVKDGPAFVPATVLDVPGSCNGGAAALVVDFANGTKVRIASGAPCDFAATGP